MIVRKLRLENAWSQEQLAEITNLSVRTIQRVERGQAIGNHSLKALANVFEIDLSQLRKEKDMQPEPKLDSEQLESTKKKKRTMTWEEQRALEYVRDIKGFYTHVLSFVVIVSCLFIFNYIISPDFIWAWYTLFGWGIGVVAHGISVFEIFNMFDANWERKQVLKRLRKK